MPGPNDKEVDFSNFFKKQANTNSKAPSKSKPVPSKPGRGRLVIMVVIMIGLAAALGYVLYQNKQGKVVTIPAGYHLVGAPARLEKIK